MALSPSVAEQLRSSIAKARKPRSQDFQIPGYEPELYITCRAITDYSEIREASEGLKLSLTKANADDELQLGIRTLAIACQDVKVKVDGKKTSLGMRLGYQLYEAITGEDLPEGSSDADAILLTFANTVELMGVFGQYEIWNDSGQRDAEEAASGESRRASRPRAKSHG